MAAIGKSYVGLVGPAAPVQLFQMLANTLSREFVAAFAVAALFASSATATPLIGFISAYMRASRMPRSMSICDRNTVGTAIMNKQYMKAYLVATTNDGAGC